MYASTRETNHASRALRWVPPLLRPRKNGTTVVHQLVPVPQKTKLLSTMGWPNRTKENAPKATIPTSTCEESEEDNDNDVKDVKWDLLCESDSGDKNAVTVSVHPTTGGQFTIQVTITDPVDTLKKVVSHKLKVPKERICLLYRDRELVVGLECRGQRTLGEEGDLFYCLGDHIRREICDRESSTSDYEYEDDAFILVGMKRCHLGLVLGYVGQPCTLYYIRTGSMDHCKPMFLHPFAVDAARMEDTILRSAVNFPRTSPKSPRIPLPGNRYSPDGRQQSLPALP
ncbi:unnamed protein product [Notodromas monacha]|uniref:Ubiquitin-like domain-containing protein n=1 Tax=Notodromas monacha TaxID=399045 RepID=A0A7R9BDD9_9CRUS|nr:unnamed protein product [Notodromas monacha]CAG0913311.1 unnamed protein product [Notodromas monacha]